MTALRLSRTAMAMATLLVVAQPFAIAQGARDSDPIKSLDEAGGPPARREFLKTVQNAILGKLDAPAACANSEKGMRLAIKFTRDPAIYEAERASKQGVLIDDFATWAMAFLTKECPPNKMKVLVEELIQAEAKASKPSEAALCLTYFSAADFYLNRLRDTQQAEKYFDLAAQAIPKVKYENTLSWLPEKFALNLSHYEDLLAKDPAKADRKKQIKILRIQQQAKHINNAGNSYLKSVFRPVPETGLQEYEVRHAIEAFTQAIQLIPRWAEPYRGRARAYELLGDNKLAEKDLARAKELEQ